jgi:hypothetical protein
MRLHRLTVALAVLGCLACEAYAEEAAPPPPQAIAFRPVYKTVTVKEQARIYDRPGGAAVFRLRSRGGLIAQAVSEDGRWWEISLPNGSVGYVHTTSLVTEP